MYSNLFIIFAIINIIGITPTDYKSECLESSGKWIEKHNECEFVGKEWCDQRGGVFNECSSACRHNPKAEMCIMVCVPVCKIK
ncbi:MAG TPA: hypothetical protein PKU93_01570 [Candidatus Pacearchaeota archaeon]|nr:hypothetical protein [Candidatus Pacearchaeota archaeon]